MQNTYREIYLGVYALTSRRGKASKSNKVLFASLVKLFVAEHARSNVVVFSFKWDAFSNAAGG